MIFIIPWETFHLKYLNQNTIYVKEDDFSWELYTFEGLMHIKTIVTKSESQAENMMFIERYLASRTNIVKVIKVISMEEKKIKPENEEIETPEISKEIKEEEE